jgi:hypothetical protein
VSLRRVLSSLALVVIVRSRRPSRRSPSPPPFSLRFPSCAEFTVQCAWGAGKSAAMGGCAQLGRLTGIAGRIVAVPVPRLRTIPLCRNKVDELSPCDGAHAQRREGSEPCHARTPVQIERLASPPTADSCSAGGVFTLSAPLSAHAHPAHLERCIPAMLGRPKSPGASRRLRLCLSVRGMCS